MISRVFLHNLPFFHFTYFPCLISFVNDDNHITYKWTGWWQKNSGTSDIIYMRPVTVFIGKNTIDQYLKTTFSTPAVISRAPEFFCHYHVFFRKISWITQNGKKCTKSLRFLNFGKIFTKNTYIQTSWVHLNPQFSGKKGIFVRKGQYLEKIQILVRHQT